MVSSTPPSFPPHSRLCRPARLTTIPLSGISSSRYRSNIVRRKMRNKKLFVLERRELLRCIRNSSLSISYEGSFFLSFSELHTEEEGAAGRRTSSPTKSAPILLSVAQSLTIYSQLPRKRDNIVLCPLTHLQLGVYQRLLAQPEVQIMLTSQDPCRCGRRDSSGFVSLFFSVQNRRLTVM